MFDMGTGTLCKPVVVSSLHANTCSLLLFRFYSIPTFWNGGCIRYYLRSKDIRLITGNINMFIHGTEHIYLSAQAPTFCKHNTHTFHIDSMSSVLHRTPPSPSQPMPQVIF